MTTDWKGAEERVQRESLSLLGFLLFFLASLELTLDWGI